MGLYPVCPGSGEYATGAPLFDRIDVTLPNGRVLEIQAPGAEARRFPAAPAPRIRRTDLLKGGPLRFGAER
jgi:putative alpha-1,2-mannosidase